MTMTPQSSIQLETVESVEFTNVTYRLDYESLRISGKIDELDAVIQALYKILNTERYAYEIYPDSYGVEFDGLIGQDKDYVRAELPRRIIDALKVDDRVRDVTDMAIKDGDTLDTMTVDFAVRTIEGVVQMNVEVMVL